MTWISRDKRIITASVQPHTAPPNSEIKGRPPGVTSIRFTPQELFGAMARCSHLHLIDPAAVTTESECCRLLIAHHVDEPTDDFSLLASVKRLKDSVRSHMIGSTGTGIAYLQMIRDGYVWCDHFENLSLTKRPNTKKSPDYVFSRPGQGDVAITESKATQGSSRAQFKRTVESGYLEQVGPFLGFEIGGAIASHGYSIGSWMTSPTRAELLIDHTAAPVTATPGPGDTRSSPSSVKRGNYLTVLSLLFGPAASTAARAGQWVPSERDFPIVNWIGRDWVTGYSVIPGAAYEMVPGTIAYSAPIRLLNPFALELGVARTFFKTLSRLGDDESDPLAELGRMDDALIARAMEEGGAVYPDGFAVLARHGAPVNVLTWNPLKGDFNKQETTKTNIDLEKPGLQRSAEPSTWMLEEERLKLKLTSETFEVKTEPEPLRLTVRRSD
jgi:hypothetical protein